MKLYYMPGACPLASHIALEWAGASCDLERLAHDDLKKPAYLRVNPQGAVPALELDDGTILTQNASVLAYISDSYPEAKLEGDGSKESRAEVHRWFGLVNSDMHPAFKPLFGATAYLGDEGMIAKSKEQAKKKVRDLFEIVNARFSDGRDWVAGHRSIADAYLYVMTRWARGQKIDLSGLDGIARFEQRMQADPAVQRALKAEGLA